MVKKWFGLDKRTDSIRKGFSNFWDSSCLTFSQIILSLGFSAALTLWWSSPWKSMDHLISTVGFFPFQYARCSMLFWKGVPKCSKRFRKDNCNKILPTKVVMKRLLQLQLSNFGMDSNLKLPFFGSEHLKNFTNNFATSLSDSGCRVQSRVGNSTGIISGTTSPQGKRFVIAHSHWCSRWLLNFYPKDHQPCEEVKHTRCFYPQKRPHGCLE